MKPRRGGTVRDPVTPGAPCPPSHSPAAFPTTRSNQGTPAPLGSDPAGLAQEKTCALGPSVHGHGWAPPRRKLRTPAARSLLTAALVACTADPPAPHQARSQPGPPAEQRPSLHVRASRIRPLPMCTSYPLPSAHRTI